MANGSNGTRATEAAIPLWAKLVGGILVVLVPIFAGVYGWTTDQIVGQIDLTQHRQTVTDQNVATLIAKLEEMEGRLDRLENRQTRQIDRIYDRLDRTGTPATRPEQ